MVRKAEIRKHGPTKMWVPREFRKSLFKLKSEEPDKTLTAIMENLGKQIKLGDIKLSKIRDEDDFWN